VLLLRYGGYMASVVTLVYVGNSQQLLEVDFLLITMKHYLTEMMKSQLMRSSDISQHLLLMGAMVKYIGIICLVTLRRKL